MENNIVISNLNDFIFCPRSIYFHNLYYESNQQIYAGKKQTKGKNAHKNIDENKYSTKKDILQGIDIFSEEFGIVGKIDLFDIETGELTERKNKISILYEGYLLQIYAQYYCLKEMGYNVKKLSFYSLKDNKKISVKKPTLKDKKRLFEIISQINNFNLDDKFSQNKTKCIQCVYRELCDYYQNDE